MHRNLFLRKLQKQQDSSDVSRPERKHLLYLHGDPRQIVGRPRAGPSDHHDNKQSTSVLSSPVKHTWHW